MADKDENDNDSITSSNSLAYDAVIANVNRESIVSIAVSARRRISPPETNMLCNLGPDVARGTYNAVWSIHFDDGVQWVFRTPLTDWSLPLEKRFQSDIWATQLIQSRTSVPIPKIVDFSVSQDNKFGRPYIIMERVKGVPLHELWFDPTWFSDEKRKVVFKSLASAMSQLQSLQFTQIGSILYEAGNYVVGPLLPSYHAICNDQIDSRGPYNTVHSFLMDTLARSSMLASFRTSLRILAGSIPDERLDGPPFVLSMPDYDFQNIYIDNDGNVTGLLDWDDVLIGPRQAGYARYPLWIVRDINEDINANFDFDMALLDEIPFPPREEIQQDWPEFLPGYRSEFIDALREVNPNNVVYCKDSHLVAPLIHEVFDIFHFGLVKNNLFKYVFVDDDGITFRYLSAIDFENGSERGEWMKRVVRRLE